MARKSVTVHYRRLSDATSAFAGQTLEAAIRAAMNQSYGGGTLSQHWKRRACLMPPNLEDTLFCNLHHDGGKHYFGDLTFYTKGFMQALLRAAEDAPQLDIEQLPAPEGQEYVHSMMYWMVIKNHVLVIQSQSLAAKDLENYLTWLLKDRTSTIDPTGQVILQAKFDPEDVGGDLEDLREIIIGGTPSHLPTISVEPVGKAEIKVEETQAYRQVAESRPWGEKARDVLRAVFNNEADVIKLMNSVPEEASLEVSVHIGYKTRRPKVSRAPMQQALRNLPEGEVKAIGKHGVLTGKDLRLTYPASINRNGNLLDPEDVVRAMLGAYAYFVQNGKIEA